MSPRFWHGWQLWEKMCFILGSSIVLVILLGLGKLAYNHHRLRKYSKVAASQAALRDTLGKSATVKRGRGADIPFGVRALESGIEVEGVWISGSNTPATSTPNSPNLTPTKEKQKENPQRQTSADAKRPASGVTRIDMPPPTLDHHPSQLYGPPSIRASYQPRRSSGLRFSDSHELRDRDDALVGLRDSGLEFHPTRDHSISTGAVPVDESHFSSWATTSYAPSDYGVHRPQTSTGTENNSVPYSAHPRYQRSDYKAPALAVQTYSEPIYAEQGHQKNVSGSPTSQMSDPFLTPTQANYLKEGPSYTSEETMSKRPISQEQAMFDQELDRVDESHRKSQTHVRDSQVLRKINSGFEILQPGSLDQPRWSLDEAAESSRGRTDVALGERRHSKKLQKRRGPD